jgi:ADP-ribosyl-[dinitrogen reductase] hydrolase
MQLDRLKGALFGSAIGDALGGTTEFMSEEQIKKDYGTVNEIIGGGKWQLEPGETTDEIFMMLSVARGIIAGPGEPVQNIADQFLHWLNSEPKNVGLTVHCSLAYFQHGEPLERAAKMAHDDIGTENVGNGSLMRTLPVGLAYSNYSKMIEVSNAQSEITHPEELASEAGALYNSVVYDMLERKLTLKEALVNRLTGTRYERSLSEEPGELPGGCVLKTFHWVTYVLMKETNFSSVVQTLANKGENANATASIAGGLSGLETGYSGLPGKFADKILIREELDSMSSDLFNIRAGN